MTILLVPQVIKSTIFKSKVSVIRILKSNEILHPKKEPPIIFFFDKILTLKQQLNKCSVLGANNFFSLSI